MKTCSVHYIIIQAMTLDSRKLVFKYNIIWKNDSNIYNMCTEW